MNTIKNVIQFNRPGEQDKWEQYCLPIGNGYMGASFFGGIEHERIVLNEKTLWTGGPSASRPDYNGGNRTGAYKNVKKVQELLYSEKYNEALELLPMLTCTSGDGYGAYQLLCDAALDFYGVNSENAVNYKRELDMDRSLYTCSYACNGTIRTIEAFASYPDRVICIRIKSDKSAGVDFRLSLNKTQQGSTVKASGGVLEYYGALEDNGLRYCGCFYVENTGGTITSGADYINVNGADEAVIFFSAATDYSDEYPSYRNGLDPLPIVREILENSVNVGFDKLYRRHYEEYSSLFDRVKLSLNGITGEIPDIETLFKEYSAGSDTSADILEALYFQFGRYMLISSSREGSLPANLQGVWNESNTPPWCCDYHINVNLQMNYWGAYNTNLAETAKPLIRYLDKMRKPGRITAKEYYNIASDEVEPENGWIAHTQANPFGWTSPGWDFYWGWSTAAVAWLMQNIWEYYEFTLDRETLEKEIYPIMRESARFYSRWLIYDDKQERLVSSPTYSPEHGPVSLGNTYEQSLILEFYNIFIKASKEIDKDNELRSKIEALLSKLKPFSIGKRGQLKEWYEEDSTGFDNSQVQEHHRHISHLLSLYPGKALTDDAELLKAAVVTLNERGDESTGWARAYKLNLWARTKDGNRAYKILRGLLTDCTFPNMFDFHPPFQLDGNFGGSAGIAEMLLQSHNGVIVPLAAIPERWNSGEYSGLCARSGFEVSACWKNGKVERLHIVSNFGMPCKIKTDLNKVKHADTYIDCRYNDGILFFETEKGGVYEIER